MVVQEYTQIVVFFHDSNLAAASVYDGSGYI